MKIIGLAGGSGSGKTTVAELFSENGFAYINTDEVYHALTSRKSPCLEDLIQEFGSGIVNAEYSLDRKALASIVFQDGAEEKRKKLNQITHFHVLSETEQMIASLDEKVFFGVLVDAPLLFESGFDKKCDKIISVIAEKSVRIARIIKRDSISEEKAEARIKAQLSDEFLKAHSDYLIVNNGDFGSLRKRVYEISEQIKNS